MVCPFVAGIGRAGASQFVSSFAASNEGALTPEPWKARFLVAEGSRRNQKATQKILNLTFDPLKHIKTALMVVIGRYWSKLALIFFIAAY